MITAENFVTEMITAAGKATGVNAETTGLANGTRGVTDDAQEATDVDEVMDIDVNTVETASVNSSPDTEPESTEELEGRAWSWQVN